MLKLIWTFYIYIFVHLINSGTTVTHYLIEFDSSVSLGGFSVTRSKLFKNVKDLISNFQLLSSKISPLETIKLLEGLFFTQILIQILLTSGNPEGTILLVVEVQSLGAILRIVEVQPLGTILLVVEVQPLGTILLVVEVQPQGTILLVMEVQPLGTILLVVEVQPQGTILIVVEVQPLGTILLVVEVQPLGTILLVVEVQPLGKNRANRTRQGQGHSIIKLLKKCSIGLKTSVYISFF